MKPRGTSNVVGILWLGLAFALFFLTLLEAAFVFLEASLVYAIMGSLALVLSALLFVRGPGRGLLRGSAGLGLLFAIAGAVAYLGLHGNASASSPVLIFVGVSAVIGIVSLMGSRHGA